MPTYSNRAVKLADELRRKVNKMREEKTSNELVGDIIGGMIAFDQSTTNQLLGAAWGSAEEWATRYRDLYAAVARLNRDVRVDDVMQYFGPGDLRSIEHYRKMQGKAEDHESY